MKKNKNIRQIGIDTLKIEIEALEYAISNFDDNFETAVKIILESKGRVVVIGMGKSGLVGRKIASTLASTGTPSFFLHPAEGVHGDLGMLVKGDVAIAISNSGETEEIKTLLPLIKRLGIKLISIVGNVESTLAKKSDAVLNAGVKREACPLNLAPTSSTTVSLALGDAIAVALVDERGFTAEDFALLHPSGSLGKRLLITVEDIMHTGESLPFVYENALVSEAATIINEKRFGSTAVLNKVGEVIGIITDGDLRRGLTKHHDIYNMKVSDIMTTNPKVINENDLAASAIRVMESFSISTIFVLDNEKKLKGIIHFQDLLKAGLL